MFLLSKKIGDEKAAWSRPMLDQNSGYVYLRSVQPRGRECVEVKVSAPKARNVKAWGNAPGQSPPILEALKARHRAWKQKTATAPADKFAPSALGTINRLSWGVAPGFHISRLWRCLTSIHTISLAGRSVRYHSCVVSCLVKPQPFRPALHRTTAALPLPLAKAIDSCKTHN